MPFLNDGTPVDIILNPLGVPGRMNIGQVLEVHLGWAAHRLGFRVISPIFDGANETEIEAELARAWLMDEAWKQIMNRSWEWIQGFEDYDPQTIRDDDEVRQLYLENWLGDKYDVNEFRSNENYLRRAVMTEWLRDQGYVPETILGFDEVPMGAPQIRDEDLLAINVGLREWLKSYGQEVADLADADVRTKASEYSAKSGLPMPILGKQVLRNGKTGDPFDQPVTVGVMTMLKLHHLVEDKVHARSTGPYSLVTQQPLGGKAQFGGQRFGEMEVWALEAYGAAYTLQEMLTVKSDDVQGRVSAYEAIVKGLPLEEPSLPASFRVLVKELQSLGLAVEALMDTKEVIKFGKDEERIRPPKLETGLLGLGEDLED